MMEMLVLGPVSNRHLMRMTARYPMVASRTANIAAALLVTAALGIAGTFAWQDRHPSVPLAASRPQPTALLCHFWGDRFAYRRGYRRYEPACHWLGARC